MNEAILPTSGPSDQANQSTSPAVESPAEPTLPSGSSSVSTETTEAVVDGETIPLAPSEPSANVTYVMVTNDYSQFLDLMESQVEYSRYTCGFCLFICVVIICRYTYKFFNMFF